MFRISGDLRFTHKLLTNSQTSHHPKLKAPSATQPATRRCFWLEEIAPRQQQKKSFPRKTLPVVFLHWAPLGALYSLQLLPLYKINMGLRDWLLKMYIPLRYEERCLVVLLSHKSCFQQQSLFAHDFCFFSSSKGGVSGLLFQLKAEYLR